MSNVLSAPWMGPVHGTTSFATSKDALLLLFQRSNDGKHIAVLPVSGRGFGSTYVTSDSHGRGSVVVRGMDDFEEVRKVQVIIAVGNNPLETVSFAVGYLKKLIMGGENGLRDLLLKARLAAGFKAREGLFEELKRWRAECWREWYGSESESLGDTARCNVVLEVLAGYAEQIVDGTVRIEEVTEGRWPYAGKLGELIKERISKFLDEKGDELCAEKEVTGDRSIWEDGVSYCTWNGLGWDLSEERIIGALEQLEDAGVKGIDSLYHSMS